MPMKHQVQLIILLSILPIIAMAQDYFAPDANRFQDQIFKDNIKTARLYVEGWEMAEPVINLSGNEQLVLSFDDLDADEKVFNYTLIHCDADWNPSDLDPSEFMESFEDDEIRSYQMSYNTLQQYTHYEVRFPNRNMKPMLSGNYIVLVYEDKPEEPSFSLRFRILEQKVNITNIRVRKPVIINLRDTDQQVEFAVNAGSYPISFPERNLKTCIVQNGRDDNVIWLQPREIRENKYFYDPTEGNIFKGGNQFRNFDITSLKYNTEYVSRIESPDRYYDVFLQPGKIRAFEDFLSVRDINGNYIIKNVDGTNYGTESEYAYVNFYLPYDAPLVDGSLYVFGKMTHWRFTEEAKMKYNYEQKAYEATLYLKQGYYNYVFAFLPNNSGVADATFIEGSFFDTDNDYSIYVYYREPGDRYDRLIGSSRFNSHSN